MLGVALKAGKLKNTGVRLAGRKAMSDKELEVGGGEIWDWPEERKRRKNLGPAWW